MPHDFKSTLMLAAMAALPVSVLAHGTDDHAKAPKAAISTEVHAFGVEGDPGKATRTIDIAAHDSMNFSRTAIHVKQGETITFVIANKGKLPHEMVIGTAEELRKHAELMRKNPGMEHDEPYMAHVKPGTKQSLTWRFTRPGTFEFGCLVAGHFEAGMKGKIVVASSK